MWGVGLKLGAAEEEEKGVIGDGSNLRIHTTGDLSSHLL